MQKCKNKEAKVKQQMKEAHYIIKLGHVKSILAATMKFNVPKDWLYRHAMDANHTSKHVLISNCL